MRFIRLGAVALAACATPVTPSRDAGPPCTPDCASVCAGSPDGCGGTCRIGGCQGCCNGDGECAPGLTPAACGVAGNVCLTCPSGALCRGGECCTPAPAPACVAFASFDGCGDTVPASCPPDAGACCGESCCRADQVCLDGDTCCTPSCAGQCPGAPDGCGGSCGFSDAFADAGCLFLLSDGGEAPGCCDTAGACLPGARDSACGPGLFCADCRPAGETCAGLGTPTGYCCTVGGGCVGGCGEEQLDTCNLPCANTLTCPGCCDGDRNCNAGTAAAACGIGGACASCGGSAPVCNVVVDPVTLSPSSASCGVCPDGAQRQGPCVGGCGLVAQACELGDWVDTGACVNCVTWAEDEVALGAAEAAAFVSCNGQGCCLASGAVLGNSIDDPGPDCCSGAAQTYCDEEGNLEVCHSVCQ